MISRFRILGFRVLHRYRLTASTSQSFILRFLSSNTNGPFIPSPPEPRKKWFWEEDDQKEKKLDDEHEHGVHNPGAPSTLDTLPVPFKNYKMVYAELQRKFNMYLAASLILFAGSIYLVFSQEVIPLDDLAPPQSYKRRWLPYPKKSDESTSEVKVITTEKPAIADKSDKRKNALPIVEEAAPVLQLDSSKPKRMPPKEKEEESIKKEKKISTVYPKIPEEIPYLLIGSGTSSHFAALTIRARDADAKILIVGDEFELPYDKSELSKALWWYGGDDVSKTLEYKAKSGRLRSVYYETDGFYLPPDEVTDAEHGGISLILGHRITKLDIDSHTAHLDDGRTIKYKKCLIATGGRPKNLSIIEKSSEGVKRRTTLFRTINDFKRLNDVANRVRSITIIGGGFLGSELAYSMNRRYGKSGLTVNQIFREKGNISEVLPEFLSVQTSKELKKSGVNVFTGQEVVKITADEDIGCLILTLSSGEVIKTDHIVVDVGIIPNVELGITSGLEVDKKHGGFIVDAELRARTDVWVAGDVSCFYDVKLGRRRVEHWENAEITGRLAGENMTGGNKAFWHQSSYYSIIAPNVSFQGIGRTDSILPTVSIFVPGKDETEHLSKGVVFYMEGRTIVGIVLFNVFGNSINVARRILADGKEHDDLKEVAKLFDLYGKEDDDDE